jgi:hypothetical protein
MLRLLRAVHVVRQGAGADRWLAFARRGCSTCAFAGRERLEGDDVEYKLSAVRVFVTDWERAIRFYSET